MALPSSMVSSSTAKYLAPVLSSNAFAFLQNGHRVQLKTTTCITGVTGEQSLGRYGIAEPLHCPCKSAEVHGSAYSILFEVTVYFASDGSPVVVSSLDLGYALLQVIYR